MRNIRKVCKQTQIIRINSSERAYHKNFDKDSRKVHKQTNNQTNTHQVLSKDIKTVEQS